MSGSYPKWVYSINEIHTRANMKKVDDMRAKWYRKAENLFPDFFKMSLKERFKAKRRIDEAVGYSYPV